VIEGDITRPAAWLGAFEKVDAVVHSAAIHHTEQIAKEPVKSIDTNLRGTRQMLASAEFSNVKRFVFLSSGKIYGEPLTCPSSEDDLLNPVEPYGLAKAMSEQYCRYYAARRAMRCVSVRPFSVYGPGQDLTTGYIGQLIDAALARRPVTLSGRPDFVRDFVHVDDVAKVCLAAAEADQPFDVVNAGSGRGTILSDLVSELATVCGHSIDVRYRTARTGTIERTLADVRRELPLLGRSPISLRSGLSQTIEWFAKANSAVA
jgi:UDP-glucose 4-epimerase